jgi:hypothetical protein
MRPVARREFGVQSRSWQSSSPTGPERRETYADFGAESPIDSASLAIGVRASCRKNSNDLSPL